MFAAKTFETENSMNENLCRGRIQSTCDVVKENKSFPRIKSPCQTESLLLTSTQIYSSTSDGRPISLWQGCEIRIKNAYTYNSCVLVNIKFRGS
jgi:hypothetical protein